jgi:hypothetical protein
MSTIRLLSKQEVDKAKAIDRKREVDEGLKLARKVDDLREIVVQEEASLEKFRRATVANIHTATTEAQRILDQIKAEVAVLRREHKDLERVLAEDWSEVGEAQPALAKLRKSLEEKEKVLVEAERMALAELEYAKIDRIGAGKDRRQASSLLNDALQDKREAMIALEKVHKMEKNVKDTRTVLEQEFTDRDKVLAKKERDFALKEHNVTERERELSVGWKILNDRKAMFERTIKRNKL